MMRTLIVISLSINLLVLFPVCMGLIRDAGWATTSYGPGTPARQILLSVYLAIFVVSALLLVSPDPKLVAALLLVQIIYKLITPVAVGTLGNPVVISNILIALFHSGTLFVIWQSGALRG
jgi:hypothetical protein